MNYNNTSLSQQPFVDTTYKLPGYRRVRSSGSATYSSKSFRFVYPCVVPRKRGARGSQWRCRALRTPQSVPHAAPHVSVRDYEESLQPREKIVKPRIVLSTPRPIVGTLDSQSPGADLHRVGEMRTQSL